MVTLAKQKFVYLPNGLLDIDAWLNKIKLNSHLKNNELLYRAIQIAEDSSKGLTTFYGQSCLEQGIEMAEILLEMKLDQDAIAAAIMVSAIQHTTFPIEKIQESFGERVTKLITGVMQMNTLTNIRTVNTTRNKIQLDRLRKIFLSMAADIRVVLIKLAERTCVMRGIKNINANERKHIAQETMDIYAPLANRLGIGQLKWELEDAAFHYINPEAYKAIANFLAERRIDREQRIEKTIQKLNEALIKANLNANITGRAKHIYSIYLKTLHKHLDYHHIYDYSAIRILVSSLTDCYAALSVVHSLFEHIPEEFDDYISHPKANGYRSIHTAVIGLDKKNLEIQIRTTDMHTEAEHGVAAHWVYKEQDTLQSSYEAKITFLRQLLAWHKEVVHQDDTVNKNFDKINDDTVYVFTPAGEIIDLPIGSTPLDFAYHIHTALGHRCRGAKIKGHIVPLTYKLRTGDQVEIITTQRGTPSRDWLNKEAGYLHSARARSKVAHWFKQQEITQYIEAAKNSLERELTRAGIAYPNLEKIAMRFNCKNDEALFAAIAHGNIRVAQIIHALQTDQRAEIDKQIPLPLKHSSETSGGLNIDGVHDLLTRIAKCCKPVPGDAVIGYITQGRGVSIHREDCKNIAASSRHTTHRIIQVTWDSARLGNYQADLQIHALGQRDLLKEITALLVNAKIDLIALRSVINQKNNFISLIITIQVHNMTELTNVTNQIKQLPKVISIKRMSAS